MGLFNFFKKDNKEEQIHFNDLKLYENDEFYYYDKYSERVFNILFVSFINYIHEKNKQLKIRSYKIRIDKIPTLSNDNIKYIVRITKEELNIKTFLLYNLVTNIAYIIICENNANYTCSNNLIGNIQTDISLAFEKGSMDDLILNYGISYKTSSN